MTFKCGSKRIHQGFTLVELLAVMAVIGILVAVLIPVLGKLRSSAQASVCQGNIRQLSVALLLWGETNHGKLPNSANPGWDEAALSIISNARPTLWNKLLHCPADEVVRTTKNPDEPRSYSMNPVLFNQNGQYDHVGWNPVHPGTRKGGEGMRLSDIGNPSHMVMLSEKHEPVNSYKSPGWYGSTTLFNAHNGGMNASFCDGHVERIALTDDLLALEERYTRYHKLYIKNNY